MKDKSFTRKLCLHVAGSEKGKVRTMINPMKLMKIKGAWDIFNNNHPKFVPFLNAVSKNAIEEGSVIEIKVTSKDGSSYNTNVKVTQSDLDLFRDLKEMTAK